MRLTLFALALFSTARIGAAEPLENALSEIVERSIQSDALAEFAREQIEQLADPSPRRRAAAVEALVGMAIPEVTTALCMQERTCQWSLLALKRTKPSIDDAKMYSSIILEWARRSDEVAYTNGEEPEAATAWHFAALMSNALMQEYTRPKVRGERAWIRWQLTLLDGAEERFSGDPIAVARLSLLRAELVRSFESSRAQ